LTESPTVDVGVLLRAHGTAGEAHLRVDPEALLGVGSQCMLHPRRAGLSPLSIHIQSMRPMGVDKLVRLEGFATRESLLPYHGARLRIPRDRLPAAPPGEFYLWELTGAQVLDEAGQPLGKVVHLTDNGAQPLLAIQVPTDPPERQRLIPAMPPFLQHFDRLAHCLHVCLPEAYWEDA
jgi:16S rRNA processing protein RimM